MSFDKRKDYGEVHGLPGVRYVQNDKYYNTHHEEVTLDGTVILGVPEVKPSVLDNNVEQEVVEEKVDSLEKLPWQKVKAMVLAAGGEWYNKVQGIAYLRGE